MKEARGGSHAKLRRAPRGRWAAALALAGLLAGCCANPGVFNKLEQSLKTVQSYYDPLLAEDLTNNKVRQAVVAADSTLLLAGELQAQWCPPAEAVKQVELQAKEAQKLAQEAGLQATGQQTQPRATP
jgi:hypothetical protein